jgi:hypothetical protein
MTVCIICTLIMQLLVYCGSVINMQSILFATRIKYMKLSEPHGRSDVSVHLVSWFQSFVIFLYLSVWPFFAFH